MCVALGRYARDAKIRGALAWRREYGVEALQEQCRFDAGEWVCRGGAPELAGLAATHALTVRQRGSRLAVVAKVARMDWHDCGVEAGIQSPPPVPNPCCLRGPSGDDPRHCGSDKTWIMPSYSNAGGGGRFQSKARLANLKSPTHRHAAHFAQSLKPFPSCSGELRYHVLVMEHALAALRRNGGEDLDLLVDTENMSLVPPPLASLQGLVELLQRAYPDRIHQIRVGPVSVILRSLYDLVTPFMRPRSRNKILLLGEGPEGSSDSDDGLA